MPIQLNITQPTSVIATYHKVVGYNGGTNSLVATVESFVEQAACDAGAQPLVTQSVEVGFVLDMPASTPSQGATIRQIVFGIIENALIVQQYPDPQSTPDKPLPLINGIFYGGVKLD